MLYTMRKISENEIEVLKKILKDASDVIMNIYDNDDFWVEYKDDNSPLTRADKASHEVLAAWLWEYFPDIAVLSEEWVQTPFSERDERGTLWSVDPLDWTKEFIKRNGEFAICLWLIDNWVPVFGMIAIPAQNTLYRWWKEYGAFKQHRWEEVISLPQREKSKKSVRLIWSRSHTGEADQSFVKSLVALWYEPAFVSAGSALKFCKLADGTADVYPRFKPTMERDTVAWDALIQWVWMHVIDINRWKEMLYNRENLRNGSFVALHRDDDQLLQF